jgi:hypothetical protein
MQKLSLAMEQLNETLHFNKVSRGPMSLLKGSMALAKDGKSSFQWVSH